MKEHLWPRPDNEEREIHFMGLASWGMGYFENGILLYSQEI
jgi:hypothetical protein